MVFDDEHRHRFNEQRRKGGQGRANRGSRKGAKTQRKTGVGSNVGYVKRSLSIDSVRGIKSMAMIISETSRTEGTAEHTALLPLLALCSLDAKAWKADTSRSEIHAQYLMCVRFVSACSSNTQLKLADWCVSPSGFAVPNWIQVSGAYRPRQRVYQPFGLENTRVLLHAPGQTAVTQRRQEDRKN